jgi:hypothetical protein
MSLSQDPQILQAHTNNTVHFKSLEEWNLLGLKALILQLDIVMAQQDMNFTVKITVIQQSSSPTILCSWCTLKKSITIQNSNEWC